MTDLIEPLMVPPGSTVRLSRDHDPGYTGQVPRQQAAGLLADGVDLLAEYQDRLAAQDTYGMLLVLQGLDASGKDSTIKHIFSGVNPQGCAVHSFKQPTYSELEHDFLWRHVIALPERGHVGIFNRSYYEECLVTRVHPDLLAKERLPPELVTRNIWRERFEDICAFERYLRRSGTVVLKFFLNISREEQRQRFLERLDDPAKVWKFSMADIAERALWPRYMAAYQDVVRHTSTEIAPWYVVPADHKWFARVVIGSAIVSALDALNLRFPRAKASLEEFKRLREALLAEGKRPAVKKAKP